MALGRKVLAILRHHQVVAVETIGQPLNPQTSDVVGTEVRDKVPEGTVLRETQIGYMWPQGLLRRAQVVISARPRTPEEASASEVAGSDDGSDVTIDQLMADASGEQEQTLRDGGRDQESER
ncbi:MAG: nucleotide exchange factor GrpE [Chloroflexi bacterium]|nr:nucleotide exchange factor GrpE [Chloroflexota bacterium]